MNQKRRTSIKDVPNLMDQWSALNEVDPESVFVSSKVKIWWKCPKGFTWYARVDHRYYRNVGCPHCSNRVIIPGDNDLQTVYPELANEWHPKNKRSSDTIAPISGYKAWWICKKGHEWEALVSSRSSLNTGCPFCSGRRAIPGETDLATLFPEIANQWNFARNRTTPDQVLPMSHASYWWTCELGHEWSAAPTNRLGSNKTGCPGCTEPHRSKIEIELLKGLNGISGQKFQYPDGRPFKVDIYLTELNTVIEYDGSRWHRDSEELDSLKTKVLLMQGIRVIRVREQHRNFNLPPLPLEHPNLVQILWKHSKYKTPREQLITTIKTAIEEHQIAR